MNFVLPGYYWVCNVVFAIAVVSDWLNDLPVAFVALNGDATYWKVKKKMSMACPCRLLLLYYCVIKMA